MPVVVTYRPQREGGKFTGSEEIRLQTLRLAAAHRAFAVDIEWDVAHALGDVAPARVFVSRHFFHTMPADLEAVWAELAPWGDVVKLAAFAHTLTDALRMCRLWQQVDKPTIAIAMGPYGVITRLCAPYFPRAFLTYGAANATQAVAPGQVSVREMHERYHVHRITPHTTIWALIAPDATSSPLIPAQNRAWAEEGRDEVILPFPLASRDDPDRVREMVLALGFHPVE